MCKAKESKEATVFGAYFFYLSVGQRLIRMDAALQVLLSVTQYIDLHAYRSSCMMCKNSFAFNPPLLVEYYEAKIQMLSVLSWKPALEMPQYVKIQIFLFLKACS